MNRFFQGCLLTLKQIKNAVRWIGRFLYFVGIQSVRIEHRFSRRVKRFFAPVTAFFKHAVDWLIGRRIRAIRREIQNIREGFVHTFQKLRRRKGFVKKLKAIVCAAGRAIRAHHGMVDWVLHVAAPIAAIALFIFAWQNIAKIEYGLKLSYNGVSLGYVKNETVVDEAVDLITDRVFGSADISNMNVVPEYTFAEIKQDQNYITAGNICDKIISVSNGVIVQAVGLYVDNEFVGAARSKADLRFILDSILKEFEEGGETVKVAFVEDIQLVEGMYPADKVVGAKAIQEKLTNAESIRQFYTVKAGDAPLSIAAKLGMTLKQLQSLNPKIDLEKGTLHVGDKLIVSAEKRFLTVQYTKKETYTKKVAFKTVTEKSSSLYIGQSRVVVSGKQGTNQVVDEVTYVDGVEISRKTISTKTVQAPVTQRVQVGTKMRPTMYYASANNSVQSTGVMMWPLPASNQYITQRFGVMGVTGNLHQAIDVAGSRGTPIYAADTGTVISAGWTKNHGYNLTIQHSNGYQTFYAHCNKLNVRAGDVVKKGSIIAEVGKTGVATGPHLHFGVCKNGVWVNPLNYVKR